MMAASDKPFAAIVARSQLTPLTRAEGSIAGRPTGRVFLLYLAVNSVCVYVRRKEDLMVRCGAILVLACG